MRPGSTLHHDDLPLYRTEVLEYPVRKEPPDSLFVQLIFLAGCSFLGSVLRFHWAIPMSMLMPAIWGSIFWFVLPLLFSLNFSRHWVAMCTPFLEPGERATTRQSYGLAVTLRVILFPLFAPWGALCCLIHFDELCRAWGSYCTYNLRGIEAPGVLVSPAGPQIARAFCLRLAVFMSAFLAEDLGLSIFIMTSIVLGPSLGSLRGHRCV